MAALLGPEYLVAERVGAAVPRVRTVDPPRRRRCCRWSSALTSCSTRARPALCLGSPASLTSRAPGPGAASVHSVSSSKKCLHLLSYLCANMFRAKASVCAAMLTCSLCSSCPVQSSAVATWRVCAVVRTLRSDFWLCRRRMPGCTPPRTLLERLSVRLLELGVFEILRRRQPSCGSGVHALALQLWRSLASSQGTLEAKSAGLSASTQHPGRRSQSDRVRPCHDTQRARLRRPRAHVRPSPSSIWMTMTVMSSVRASVASHALYDSTTTARHASCGSLCFPTCRAGDQDQPSVHAAWRGS